MLLEVFPETARVAIATKAPMHQRSQPVGENADQTNLGPVRIIIKCFSRTHYMNSRILVTVAFHIVRLVIVDVWLHFLGSSCLGFALRALQSNLSARQ